jgi:hypothetical protein
LLKLLSNFVAITLGVIVGKVISDRVVLPLLYSRDIEVYDCGGD